MNNFDLDQHQSNPIDADESPTSINTNNNQNSRSSIDDTFNSSLNTTNTTTTTSSDDRSGDGEGDDQDDLNKTYSVSQDDSPQFIFRGQEMQQLYQENQSMTNRLPNIRDIEDPIERENLFKEKIKLCCRLYDFNNPLADLEEKKAKGEILIELEDIIMDELELINDFESLYEQVFDMFKINIFRSLPPSSNQNVPEFDPEEDEPPLEPSWPHFQTVYGLLVQFLDSPHFNIHRAKPYIDNTFVSSLLELFKSEDPRERDHLRTIVHRIYGRFLNLRAFIRKQMGHIFCSYVCETEYNNGIADLLDIMGSIIKGFVLPLKDEHKVFLLKVLMPLHKTRTLNAYHTQLALCVINFLEKDQSLNDPVVKNLLRFWPKVHSTKEVMFLNEIEEILEIIEPVEFQKIMVDLFKQLARCIKSHQFQVAERVLYFWNNEYILSLINDNFSTILPIIFPALHTDTCSHWNKTIHGLIYNAIKLSTEMDQRLFNKLVQEHELNLKQIAILEEEKLRKWRKIAELAEENANKMDYTLD